MILQITELVAPSDLENFVKQPLTAIQFFETVIAINFWVTQICLF